MPNFPSPPYKGRDEHLGLESALPWAIVFFLAYIFEGDSSLLVVAFMALVIGVLLNILTIYWSRC